MPFKRKDWILISIVLLSAVTGLVLYPILPDQMPTHWNVEGIPDRFDSKNFAVFFFPMLNLVLLLLMIWLPRFDPRHANYFEFVRVYTIVRWAIILFLTVLYLSILYYSVAEMYGLVNINISLIVPFFVGILLIVIGNYLTRAKSNYFFGIRTPWTLENERVWKKTHRLGGRLFVLGGFITLAGLFLPNSTRFVAVIAAIILASVIPILYSYFIYRKEVKK